MRVFVTATVQFFLDAQSAQNRRAIDYTVSLLARDLILGEELVNFPGTYKVRVERCSLDAEWPVGLRILYRKAEGILIIDMGDHTRSARHLYKSIYADEHTARAR